MLNRCNQNKDRHFRSLLIHLHRPALFLLGVAGLKSVTDLNSIGEGFTYFYGDVSSGLPSGMTYETVRGIKCTDTLNGSGFMIMSIPNGSKAGLYYRSKYGSWDSWKKVTTS